jgi:hypothetical protein
VKLRLPDEWTNVEREAARAVLLEPSPHDADGGELVGRDPRKVSAEEFARAGIDGAALSAVIRARCLDCAAGLESEVRRCVSVTCPNWPYRMGVNPFHRQNLSDEERARRSERARALSEALKGTGENSLKAAPVSPCPAA